MTRLWVVDRHPEVVALLRECGERVTEHGDGVARMTVIDEGTTIYLVGCDVAVPEGVEVRRIAPVFDMPQSGREEVTRGARRADSSVELASRGVTAGASGDVQGAPASWLARSTVGQVVAELARLGLLLPEGFLALDHPPRPGAFEYRDGGWLVGVPTNYAAEIPTPLVHAAADEMDPRTGVAGVLSGVDRRQYRAHRLASQGISAERMAEADDEISAAIAARKRFWRDGTRFLDMRTSETDHAALHEVAMWLGVYLVAIGDAPPPTKHVEFLRPTVLLGAGPTCHEARAAFAAWCAGGAA